VKYIVAEDYRKSVSRKLSPWCWQRVKISGEQQVYTVISFNLDRKSNTLILFGELEFGGLGHVSLYYWRLLFHDTKTSPMEELV